MNEVVRHIMNYGIDLNIKKCFCAQKIGTGTSFL